MGPGSMRNLVQALKNDGRDSVLIVVADELRHLLPCNEVVHHAQGELYIPPLLGESVLH